LSELLRLSARGSIEFQKHRGRIMKLLLKPQRVVLIFVALCIVVALVLTANSDDPSGAVEWLSGPPPPRTARLAFLGRWSGPVRGQLSRLKQRVLGMPKLVDVQGAIYEFDGSVPLPASAVALTNRSGAKVFVVSDGGAFEEKMKKSPEYHALTGSRLMVANGMQGQMAMYERVSLGLGTNRTMQNIGWWLDILPSAGARSVELTCFLTGTERAFRPAGIEEGSEALESFLRTNVAIGARVKIPPNGSLFLVASGTNQNGKVVGAILSPRIWQTK
jgi:hypothetical protein